MKKKVFLGIVPPQVTLRGQESRPQPPMGLAYVLNGAERAGWQPVVLDSCAEGNHFYTEDLSAGIRVTGLPVAKVLERIEDYSPDMIGLHLGVSTDHDYAKKLVVAIRDVYPTISIVTGGSQASLMHREILSGFPIERIPVDIVITGRDLASGEYSLECLLRTLDNSGQLDQVPGIAFRRNSRVVITSPVNITESILDSLSLPRRDLFARINGVDIYSVINRSHTGTVDHTPYAVMHTSRGCGGQCTFCHVNYGGFDNTLIGRSLANIGLELDDLRRRGVNTISIEDDNFGGFSSERTAFSVEILREIAKRNFQGVYFPNGVTIRSMINNNFILLRQLRHMADQGTKIRNSLPIESGDSETLSRIIHKPHNLEMVEKMLGELRNGGYLHHSNLKLDAFFMVGVTGYGQRTGLVRESMSAIERTFGIARRVGGLGILVNVWWMKPNPNGPQYKLWRAKFPRKPFYELQFLFPSGIWGTEEEEMTLDAQIREINKEMVALGVGSKRPIYPT